MEVVREETKVRATVVGVKTIDYARESRALLTAIIQYSGKA